MYDIRRVLGSKNIATKVHNLCLESVCPDLDLYIRQWLYETHCSLKALSKHGH